jgi:hypothetical protein
MKLAIVGGGYSGGMTALALAQQGHQVTLYEAADALGGIVRDVVLPQGRFLRGCQYMSLDPCYQPLWDDLDGLALRIFPHHYGAWCDLFGSVQVQHDFAQPIVPGILGALAEVPAEGVPVTSVADYLHQYEPRVASALTDWACRLCDVDDLISSNVVHLQLSRVYYPQADDAVLASKQADSHADRLLGIPRSRFDPPVPIEGAALPVHGFDDYMGRLQERLVARGVEVRLNAPVKPVRSDDGRCRLRLRGEPIEADWVVWCANPAPLLQVLTGRRLDSASIPCVYLYATVEGNVPADPVYYQTFGREHPLLRLFVYPMDGSKLTIEALDEGWSLDRLVACANRVMQDLGWDARIAEAALAPQRRFTLTRNDADCLAAFAGDAPSLGVVTGGWQHYGRDARMHDILSQLNRLGAL